MKNIWIVLLLGLVAIISGWWVLQGSSTPRPEENIIDVWATWGDEEGQLQELFDRYSQTGGLPVRVRTRVRGDDLLESLKGSEPPDLVILSTADPVKSYAEQKLLEPLDGWIELREIDLEDIFPASLGQCRGTDSQTLCLPWGSDVDVLYWNKDLFRAAGLDPELPPQTMEELVEYAGKLTMRDMDGELVQAGFIPDYPHAHSGSHLTILDESSPSIGEAKLANQSPDVAGSMSWKTLLENSYAPGELDEFISSFTPYMTSSHPVFAGRRLSCHQCHRSTPVQNKPIPETGFYEGQIAMMLDGQWLVGHDRLSAGLSQVDYGLAPFPPISTTPQGESTPLVQGPVVVIPSSSVDKEFAAQLLAWMSSPKILAEAAYTNAMLPSSYTAATDSKFQQIPYFEMFLDLISQTSSGRLSSPQTSLGPGNMHKNN